MAIRRFLVPTALLVVVLSGCASLPADYGRDDVAILLKERGYDVSVGGDTEAAERLLAEFSGKPLTAGDVVRFALINNPRLMAEYAKLGFAAADVYEAGRLSNPRLSASILFVDEPGLVDKLDFGLTQSFTNFLLLPARSRFAEGEFALVKQLVGAETLNLAAEAETAHYRLVGALQSAAMRESVARVAQASAELAQRFFDAGNISRLELAMEQGAASQARLDLLQARAEATVARSELNILMGLPAQEDRWAVENRLPAPVAEEDSLAELLKVADTSRLDLAAARKRVSLFADALGVTRRFRYLGEVRVGVGAERDTDGSRHLGPELSLELPIFNQGKGRVVRAETGLQKSEAELRSLEFEISNGVQRAAAEVATAKARAEEYRQSLIPLREAIVARTLEEVNFMLKGQFELLLAKQQEYDAYQGYLEAVRDYWVARVGLSRQIGRPLPSQATVGNSVLEAPTLITPGDSPMDGMNEAEGMDMSGMNHSGHEMKATEHASGSNPNPAAPSGHGGHGMDKTGMEGMGPHEDGKDMPAHGTPRKPATEEHDASMENTERSGDNMDGMKGMEMPEETSEETQHGDHQ